MSERRYSGHGTNPADRPSIDVASADFSLHSAVQSQAVADDSTSHTRSSDEVEKGSIASPSSEAPTGMRRKSSIRSFFSRRSARHDENHMETIKEETDSTKSSHDLGDDTYLVDMKEAKNQMESHLEGETPAPRRKGFRDNLQRHRNIQKYTKESKVVSFLRKAYYGVLSRSLLTRSFIWWLPLALVLFIPLAVDAFGKEVLVLGHVRVMWLFIWLEVCWGAVFIARQVAHYLPATLGVVVAIVAPRYFAVIDALIALEIPVTMVFGTLVWFITLKPITSTNPKALWGVSEAQQWQNILQSVLVAFFVTALVFLVEQIFMHLLSVSYHKTRMALRIKQNKHSTNLITQLLRGAYNVFPFGCPEFEEEDSVMSSALLATTKRAHRTFKKFVGERFDPVAARLPSSTPINMRTAPNPEKLVKECLTNSLSREVLANRIWKSLVLEDSDCLTMQDIHEALGNEVTKDDLLYIFDLLDQDGEGGITLEEMVSAVRSVGKEGKHISRALQDIDGAITKLHHLLLVIVAIIIVVVFVGMLAPSVGTVLATFGTTMLSFSFIFSTTCQEILASCVFLFVKHPIDVGDVVAIDFGIGSLGQRRLNVLSINLLSTVFEDANTNVIRQASNAVLNTLFIDNITRSPPQSIELYLTLGLPDTKFSDLEEFRRRMTQYLNDHPRDYKGSFFFQVIGQPDLDRIQLLLIVTCRNNQVDSDLFSMRRTRVLEFVARCIHDIPLHIPRRDASHLDPATAFYTSNREVPINSERTRYGMVPEEDHLDPAKATGSIRRSSSTATATTGLRTRKMVQPYRN